MNDENTTQPPDSNDETKGVAERLQDTAGKIGHLLGDITENVKERIQEIKEFPTQQGAQNVDTPGLAGNTGAEDEMPSPTSAPPVGEGTGTSGGPAGKPDSEPDTKRNYASPQH